MKTIAPSLTVSVAIYTTLFLLIASIAFGSELNLNQPKDSLFTSEEIAFEEEEYIDDIPFDTKAVAEAYRLEELMNVEFDFEEEAYIDDIPFDTYKVAKSYKIEESLRKMFDFEEEAYVDDIPFNTERIASEVFFIYYYKK